MLVKTYCLVIFLGLFSNAQIIQALSPPEVNIGTCSAVVVGPQTLIALKACVGNNDLATFVIGKQVYQGRCIANVALDVSMCMFFPSISLTPFGTITFDDDTEFTSKLGVTLSEHFDLSSTKTFIKEFADGNHLTVCGVNSICQSDPTTCVNERKTVAFLKGELVTANDLLNECLRR